MSSEDEQAMPGIGDPREASDAALVEAMARGETAALGALYDRYGATLLAVAQRFLGTTPAAEDLVHDVLLEAWGRAATFDRQRGSVRTWLLVRLRSRALDRLRRRRRGQTILGELAAAGSTELAAMLAADPLRQREILALRQALGELAAAHLQVLELAYFGGLSMTEIAATLEIPVGTAKSRMAAALSRLRVALGATSTGRPRG